MELLYLVLYVVMGILVGMKLTEDIADYAGQDVIDEKGHWIGLLILVMAILWPMSVMICFFNPISEMKTEVD